MRDAYKNVRRSYLKHKPRGEDKMKSIHNLSSSYLKSHWWEEEKKCI